MNKPKQLPIIIVGKKKYFLDEKLMELRNVNNPHDRLDYMPITCGNCGAEMSESEEYYEECGYPVSADL